MRSPIRSFAPVAMALLAMSACETGEAAEERGPRLITAQATRGDLLIRAEATGTVEPVRTVEVKSKASGEILRLYTDIGDVVTRGALLAEIDPRDVRNRFNQTQADLTVAEAQLEIAEAQLDRQRQLLDAQVITQAEFENARLSHANGRANLVRAQTNHDLAELQVADVSIRAPMDGTIIQKNVEEGAVIQSASANVSGGTALFVMANLGEMQVRTLVDETDMGDLQSGLQATIRVEAYPDRTFQGVVDKIEPQATVEQNVTMFPVIVSIDNRSGLLRPGMNAEVEVFIDEAIDVVVVPNNSIVQTADVGPAAMALGLDVESLDLAEFMAAGRGGLSGPRGGGRPSPGSSDAPPANGADRIPPDGSAAAAGVDAPAMAQVQALREQARSGAITQDSMRVALRTLSGRADSAARGSFGGESPGGSGNDDVRPAVVFVLGPDSVPRPRLVQIGLGDWDNTQIVSGIEAGEALVIVGAAQLQAQQQEFLERMRSRGGNNPFGGGRGR
jgi:HlyD family secretion protein